jgi:protein-disulfide isomerase
VAREVREHFGDQLRYVMRHMPLPVHPHAESAALAAEAAGRQGRFWEMADRLFTHQDELELEDLVAHAAHLDLDVEMFLRDLEDEALERHVQRDVAIAEASGVRGTPTFFVGTVRHVGAYDAATLIAALERSRSAGAAPEPEREPRG